MCGLANRSGVIRPGRYLLRNIWFVDNTYIQISEQHLRDIANSEFALLRLNFPTNLCFTLVHFPASRSFSTRVVKFRMAGNGENKTNGEGEDLLKLQGELHNILCRGSQTFLLAVQRSLLYFLGIFLSRKSLTSHSTKNSSCWTNTMVRRSCCCQHPWRGPGNRFFLAYSLLSYAGAPEDDQA